MAGAVYPFLSLTVSAEDFATSPGSDVEFLHMSAACSLCRL